MKKERNDTITIDKKTPIFRSPIQQVYKISHVLGT